MRKKITVWDFCRCIDGMSDEVPVIVKDKFNVLAHFPCLDKLPSTAMPGILDSLIMSVRLNSDKIIITVK